MEIGKRLTKAIGIISLTAIAIAGIVVGRIEISTLAGGALAGWLAGEKNDNRD